MNTLIISTFSCTFEEFKSDVSGFITEMGKEVVSEYEFVQAGEHKSHLLMNVLDTVSYTHLTLPTIPGV